MIAKMKCKGTRGKGNLVHMNHVNRDRRTWCKG